MKILAIIGILFWAYCALNVISKRRYYVALGEVGRMQLGVWAVFILGGFGLCFWLLLR